MTYDSGFWYLTKYIIFARQCTLYKNWTDLQNMLYQFPIFISTNIWVNYWCMYNIWLLWVAYLCLDKQINKVMYIGTIHTFCLLPKSSHRQNRAFLNSQTLTISITKNAYSINVLIIYDVIVNEDASLYWNFRRDA